MAARIAGRQARHSCVSARTKSTPRIAYSTTCRIRSETRAVNGGNGFEREEMAKITAMYSSGGSHIVTNELLRNENTNPNRLPFSCFRGFVAVPPRSDHAIAARGLGLVHPPIRGAERRLEIVVRVELGGTGRDGHGAGRELLHADPNPLGQLTRRFEICAGQYDEKLLAAPPRHDVVRPHRLPEHGAQLPQHLVAGLMAHRVVDLLEAIDVEHDAAERLALALGARDFAGDALLAPAAIREAGQRIGGGELLERLESLVEIGRCRSGFAPASEMLVHLHRDVARERCKRVDVVGC